MFVDQKLIIDIGLDLYYNCFTTYTNFMSYILLDIIKQSIKQSASDIHLTVGYPPQLRIDGTLILVGGAPLTQEDLIRFSDEITSQYFKTKFNNEKEVDFSYEVQIENEKYRYRVNLFTASGKFCLAMRQISSEIKSIDQLGLPIMMKDFTKLNQGLVLLVGPTGCGKSTTLASLINEINLNYSKHIITVEDPIEYIYPKSKCLVVQRELYSDTLSWGNSLRSVLREDPNVVLIGEIRDADTMRAALQISETGHLVFSTMHTNSAAESIERIIYSFDGSEQEQVRAMLSNVIAGIVSQRLVPTIGGGRTAAVEIMLATPSISNMIREKKEFQINNVIRTSSGLGMMTLEKSLVDLVRGGKITIDTAHEYSRDVEEIVRLMKGV